MIEADQKLYKVEGIVLKRTAYKEVDSMVTLFTREQGKVRVLARGSLRAKSRRGPHLEPLRHSVLLISRGKGFDDVREADSEPLAPRPGDDLVRSACAQYIAELVDRLTVDQQPNERLFQLMLEALKALCKPSNQDLILRHFESWLLRYTGFQPELYRCVKCRVRLGPVDNLFSCQDGGVLCPKCKTEDSLPISVDMLKVMRFLQRNNLKTAQRLKLRVPLSQELRHLMLAYIQYTLGQKVEGADFLQNLEANKGQ